MAITITEDTIRNAESYVPIGEKSAMVDLIAPLCVREKQRETGNIIPPAYTEHREMRQLFLMGILADCYLRLDYDKQAVQMQNRDGSVKEAKLRYCMSVENYDDWCASHIMNQLERLKRCPDKEVANKVFDLLYDYKQTETMLYGAVRDELEERNDLLRRVTKLIELGSSPEILDELKEQLKEMQEKAVEENGAGLLAGA